MPAKNNFINSVYFATTSNIVQLNEIAERLVNCATHDNYREGYDFVRNNIKAFVLKAGRL